jgi:hypothetical protein
VADRWKTARVAQKNLSFSVFLLAAVASGQVFIETLSLHTYKVSRKYESIFAALSLLTYLVQASDEEAASLLLLACMVHYCSNCLGHYCHIYSHCAALHYTEQQD